MQVFTVRRSHAIEEIGADPIGPLIETLWLHLLQELFGLLLHQQLCTNIVIFPTLRFLFMLDVWVFRFFWSEIMMLLKKIISDYLFQHYYLFMHLYQTCKQCAEDCMLGNEL